ncbi:MAG: diacylglycerol kinase family protein [Coriobacteriia bacterium]|nr:diacylglycerol kinase family protein [Coriobacteriia bacterium]
MDILVIANLRSGSADAGLLEFVRHLVEGGAAVTIRLAAPHAPVDTLLKDAAAFDRVIAAGGDGTASSVLYALKDRQVPVAFFPAGTANLYARNLDLPRDPRALADLALHAPPSPYDLGEMTVAGVSKGFFVIAGAGYDAHIMAGAEPLKPSIGEGAYILAALQSARSWPSTLILTLDGKTVVTEGTAVLLVNLARIQFDLAVVHESDATDGVFEVVVMKTRSLADLVPAVWAALLDRLSSYPDRPGFEVHTARAVEVIAEPPLLVQHDGEVDAPTPLSARVLPGAALVVAPPRHSRV